MVNIHAVSSDRMPNILTEDGSSHQASCTLTPAVKDMYLRGALEIHSPTAIIAGDCNMKRQAEIRELVGMVSGNSSSAYCLYMTPKQGR